MPLFVLLFAALGLGMIVGSLATWLKQGRYRKLARQRGPGGADALRDGGAAPAAHRLAAALPQPAA